MWRKVLVNDKSRKNTLSVIPLGGVTEIGKNMLVLECNDDIMRYHYRILWEMIYKISD